MPYNYFLAVATDLSDSYLTRVGSIIAQQVKSVDELAVSFGVRVSQCSAYRSLEKQVVHLLKIWRDTKNGSKQKLARILQQHHLVLQDSMRCLQYVQPKKGECNMIYVSRGTHPNSVVSAQLIFNILCITTLISSSLCRQCFCSSPSVTTTAKYI